jgi:hypothetical protein
MWDLILTEVINDENQAYLKGTIKSKVVGNIRDILNIKKE